MELRRLVDVAPVEFRDAFFDSRAYQYRECTVVAIHDTHNDPWPGRERNVQVWWELDNGIAVGWNENPQRGWSFPVAKLKGR